MSKYLGYAPYIVYIKLIYTPPLTSNQFVYSQNWHRDYGDYRLCKLFIYLRDVEEINGPLKYFPAPISDKIPQSYRYIGHCDNGTIDDMIGLENCQPAVGDAGTAFLIDTNRCIHMGGRAKKSRLVYVIYYTTGFSWPVKTYVSEAVKKSRLPPNMSDLTKLSVGLY